MRYVRFNRWLSIMGSWEKYQDGSGQFDRKEPPDLVVWEMAHNRGGAATEILNGMVTRVQEFCARYGIEHTSCHSATLKKYITGKGNAQKEDVIMAVADKCKMKLTDIKDDNQADALALLLWARAGCPQAAKKECP